jgi:hypothetical protein
MKMKLVALAAAFIAAPAFASQQGDFKHNSVTLDPVGLLGGDGINVQYERSTSENFSALIGAGFNGFGSDANAYGLQLGGDFFLTQGHNEGLRIGPRLLLGWGSAVDNRSNLFQESVDGFRHAVGAEAGYNWISAHGLTLGAAAGLNYGFWGPGTGSTSGSGGTTTGGGTTGGGSPPPGYVTSASTSSGTSLSDRLSPYVSVKAGFSW